MPAQKVLAQWRAMVWAGAFLPYQLDRSFAIVDANRLGGGAARQAAADQEIFNVLMLAHGAISYL
jgi:hypothetical protein